MPDDDGYRGLLARSLDALVFGGIAILTMISIGAVVVAWFLFYRGT
ncbi:hypothetical protein [Teichococcus wenyumeiae]|nr:hypothetical protein [Pseudoroseomonas wenyumeiae]